MSSEKTKSEQQPGLHRKVFDPKKSASQLYKEMTVGDKGWGSWLYYELVILLFGLLPGALGLALRRIFFKPLFGRVGRNVIFGRNMNIRQPHKIKIGDNVIIDDDCTLDGKGEGNQGINIGDYVTIGRFTPWFVKMRTFQSVRMLISVRMSRLSRRTKERSKSATV